MPHEAGKTVLITGASSGIGRALAIQAGQAGHRLFLTGRNMEALHETQRLLPSGTVSELLLADLTIEAERNKLIQEVSARSAKLDMLILNAGIVTVGSLARMPAEDVQRVIDTNLTAPMLLIQALLPLLRRAAPSRIVLVGSMFGHIAFPLFAAYSASKFGLRGLADALRRELACEGIGVTYAAPRATRTAASEGFAHLAGTFRMAFDTPEAVAASILSGANRGQREILPGPAERLFLKAQALAPFLIDRTLIRQLQAIPEKHR